MDDLSEAIARLRSQLVDEMQKEVEHLQSIGGPKGLRNSVASNLGLARNSIRCEMIARLTVILEEY